MERAASRRSAQSATLKPTAWKLQQMGCPKALRREVYRVAISMAGRTDPMVMAAVPRRSGIIMRTNTSKPLLIPLSAYRSGTRTSLKMTRPAPPPRTPMSP